MHFRIFPLACRMALACLAILLLAGCLVKKGGVVGLGSPRPAGMESAVRNTPRLDPGSQVVGMVNAYVAPVFRNSPETREALTRATAAQAGADAVVGLQSCKEVHIGFESSIGLLACSNRTEAGPRPKVMTCLPPFNIKFQQTPKVKRLEELLRAEIQYFAAQHGYYVHLGDAAAGTVESIRAGQADAARLGGTLGVRADYALLGDLEAFEETGTEVLIKSKGVKLTLTLFDLEQRREVWRISKDGGMSEGALLPLSGVMSSLMTSDDEDLRQAVHNIVSAILSTMPEVPGYRKL